MWPLYTPHSDYWLGCVLSTLHTHNKQYPHSVPGEQRQVIKSKHSTSRSYSSERINRGRPPNDVLLDLEDCMFLCDWKVYDETSVLYSYVTILLLSSQNFLQAELYYQAYWPDPGNKKSWFQFRKRLNPKTGNWMKGSFFTLLTCINRYIYLKVEVAIRRP